MASAQHVGIGRPSCIAALFSALTRTSARSLAGAGSGEELPETRTERLPLGRLGVDELEMAGTGKRDELDRVAGRARGVGIGEVWLEMDICIAHRDQLEYAQREPLPRRGLPPTVW